MQISRAYLDLRSRERELDISKTLSAGAAWGAAIWTAYATVEFLLYTVVPLCSGSDATLTRIDWQVNALLLACYSVLGVIGGAVGATLAAFLSRGRASGLDGSRLGASLSLLVGLLFNLRLQFGWGQSVIVVILIKLTLIAAILWALYKPGWRLARWLEINPFLLSLLLLGPCWLGAEVVHSQTYLTKALAIFLLVAGVLGIHAAMYRTSWGAGAHFATGWVLLTGLFLLAGGRSAANKTISTASWPVIGGPQRPTVVLVTFDTTRADHLSLYGYPVKTTPHLEEFASGATLYTDAMAASDMTLNSHASIFTGVYASWHGAHFVAANPPRVQGLDGKLPTLAGMLSDQGYFTAGVAANTVFFVPDWGLTRGFTFFRSLKSLGNNANRVFNLRSSVRPVMALAMPSLDFDMVFRRAADINEDACRILDLSQKRSLFLFVNYMDAHQPYLAPSEFQAAPTKPGARLDRNQQDRVLSEAGQSRGRKSPELTQLIAQYDAGVAYEDHAFGLLIQQLKDHGVYDQSLIIVTSDHGEAFGERGLVQHGVSVYADQTHVPMVIKYPNQRTRAVVSTPVSHVDILPTVLDTLSYSVPSHVVGHSLRDPQGLAERQLVAESFPSSPYVPAPGRIERALRSGVMKLVVSNTGKQELYDLSSDTAELHNLYSADVSLAARLEATLREWIGTIPNNPGPRKLTVVERESMRLLKSLGYVQ